MRKKKIHHSFQKAIRCVPYIVDTYTDVRRSFYRLADWENSKLIRWRRWSRVTTDDNEHWTWNDSIFPIKENRFTIHCFHCSCIRKSANTGWAIILLHVSGNGETELANSNSVQQQCRHPAGECSLKLKMILRWQLFMTTVLQSFICMCGTVVILNCTSERDVIFWRQQNP